MLGRNPLVRPEHQCKALRDDGQPCLGPHRKHSIFCQAHQPKTYPREKKAPEAPAIDPEESLHDLVRLDPGEPGVLRRLAIGLMQHVGAGTINYNQASAMLRLARTAQEASPVKKDASFADAMAKV